MTERLQDLHASWNALDARFSALSLRERALLGAGLAACVFMVVDHLAIQPVAQERERIALRSTSVERERDALRVELSSLTRETMTEEERAQADEIEQLRRQIEQIDARLSKEIDALIPPQAIVAVLEEVLAELPELSVVSLESQAPERIGARAEPEADVVTPGDGLYRHGLELELEGGFAAAVRYLERLEASSWHLLWDRFDLRVEQYPRSRISIELHTLSKQEEWIGV